MNHNLTICETVEQATRNILLQERAPFVVHCGTVISLIALITNGWMCGALVKIIQHQPTQLYLAAISLADAIFSVIYITLIAGGVASEYFSCLWMHNAWMRSFRVQFTIGRCLRASMTFLVLAAIIDRAIVVTNEGRLYPTTVRKPVLIRMVVVCIMITAGIMHQVCTYWEFTLDEFPQCDGFARFSVGIGNLTINNAEYVGYKFYIAPIMSFYAPVIMIILTSIYIVWRLRVNFLGTIQMGTGNGSLSTYRPSVDTSMKCGVQSQKPSVFSARSGLFMYTSCGAPNQKQSILTPPAEPSMDSTTLWPSSAHRSSYQTSEPNSSLSKCRDVITDVELSNPSTFTEVETVVAVKGSRRKRKGMQARMNAKLKQLIIDTHKERVRDAERITAVIIVTYLIGNAIDTTVAFLEHYDYEILNRHYITYTIASDISSFLVVLMGALRVPLYCLANHTIASLVRRTFACRRRRRFADEEAEEDLDNSLGPAYRKTTENYVQWSRQLRGWQ